MKDDIPEEDKRLADSLINEVSAKQGKTSGMHRHEWVDMYNGGGFVKGHPERGLTAFFCKWCLQIRIKEFDQSRYNLNIDEDQLNDPDDGEPVV